MRRHRPTVMDGGGHPRPGRGKMPAREGRSKPLRHHPGKLPHADGFKHFKGINR